MTTLAVLPLVPGFGMPGPMELLILCFLLTVLVVPLVILVVVLVATTSRRKGNASLLACPHCGHQVSPQATSCPGCGAPLVPTK